jgi:long-chain acyl-CoA synthetase
MKNIINYKNIHDMVKVTIETNPRKTAYRWILNDKGETGSVTWSEFYEQVRAVSKSLMKLGVKKGDRVSIVSYTNYKWVISDLGTMTIGASTIGIYHSNTANETQYIIRHSGSKVLFVEDEKQLGKILSIKKRIPSVKHVVLMQGSYRGALKKRVLSFDDFLKRGSAVSDRSLSLAVKNVRPSDVATIVYTSGTTGIPKGAVITHDNIIFSSQSVRNCVPIDESDETLLFLPLAHVFARVDIYATIISNITLTFSRSMETVINDFKVVKPHWFPCVPRVFDKVYGRVTAGVETKGGLALFIFNRAFAIGYRYSDLVLQKKPIPYLLQKKYDLMSKLIFSKLREALGGRVRFCVSGAAPLNPTVARFFHAAGITILEGYGMTENCSFTNVTTLDNLKFGTVGHPAPGVEQKIADDGEILYRGRNVMKGYYKMPKETAAVLKKGWLHTGDLGILDSDGNLIITGRKKEIIITSGGKNIAPAPIEYLITSSKYINQACVIGDTRKYLTSLITLDADNITEFARVNGIPFSDVRELNTHPGIIELIDREMAKVNAQLASFETIKRYTIVPEFTIDNGTATPTLKLKKNVIIEQFKKSIETMYDTMA